ncbi:Cytosolic carboxypeptidase 1 [Polyrhizophydium stewartii]|uniref:tubulin-glutamate carboxypeptidase n=1 Tax=Polyrhizophydium stewartii TaxID=2732419 RepID=A0ABR4N421_9FUNG
MRSFQSLSISTDARRKIIRQCLDLKRLMDKEGNSIYAESSIQKTLFSRTSTSISVLFRCLRSTPDIDTCIVVTNLLLRLVTTSECNQTNLATMAKKNLTAVLMRCLQLYHQDYLVPSAPTISPNLSQRLDDVLVNIMTLLVKLSKFDVKVPLLARLHNAISISIDIIQRWLDRKDYSAMLLAFSALRTFASKNDFTDAALPSIQKSNILVIIEQILKNPPPQLSQSKLDCVVELLAIFSKSKSETDKSAAGTICLEIMHMLGVKLFLTLSTSGYDAVQRASLRLLRIVIDYGVATDLVLHAWQRSSLRGLTCLQDFGKRMFDAADGAKYLTDALHSILHTSDGASTALSSTSSTPALLVAVLRAAVAHSDLPFLPHFQDRLFPLPLKHVPGTNTQPSVSQEKSVQDGALNLGFDTLEGERDYERLVDEYTAKIRRGGKLPGCLANMVFGSSAELGSDTKTAPDFGRAVAGLDAPPDKAADSQTALTSGATADQVIAKLQGLCPELLAMSGKPLPPCEPPAPNIRVRHVQPMAPGKHIVCRNQCPSEPEMQMRRSPLSLRKIVFEHTARMFQPSTKGVLVYDVMDDRVAQAAMQMHDGTLLFDSRFESGNLQMAIRVSQFEYDLVVQTDINAMQGKHNQWFYFSVQRMVPNTPYKFNILNLSKPASQFNHGMQPVVYSVSDPGWRRSGDCVFYIKQVGNHYRKPGVAPAASATAGAGGADDAAMDGTYSTLVFTLVFRLPEDTCFIAYHYPYTYSELQRALYQFYQNPRYRHHCRRTSLCQTLGGNECILLTITDFDQESLLSNPLNERRYVHPGESNSSHIMSGLVQFLLSTDDTAVALRRRCIFKIVPMLNPDGVVNGSHRCSLAGVDLNRQWKTPSRITTPTVFWTKLLWRFIIGLGNRPLLACDFHGHSRRKNVFVFGCENGSGDAEGLEKIFPHSLASNSSIFDYSSCRFVVERSKESTARVVLWREFGLVNSFTLESSYCGADFGERKGMQFSIPDLEKMGADFCKAVHAMLAAPEFSGSEMPLACPGPISGGVGVGAGAGSAATLAAGAGSAGSVPSRLKSAPSSSSSSASTPVRQRKKAGAKGAGASSNASGAAQGNAASQLTPGMQPAKKSKISSASVAANVSGAVVVSSGKGRHGKSKHAGGSGAQGSGGSARSSTGAHSARPSAQAAGSLGSGTLGTGVRAAGAGARARKSVAHLSDSLEAPLDGVAAVGGIGGAMADEDMLGDMSRDNASNDSDSSDDDG